MIAGPLGRPGRLLTLALPLPLEWDFEDEERLRELATRLLGRLGYTVLVAANADEARRLFERYTADTSRVT